MRVGIEIEVESLAVPLRIVSSTLAQSAWLVDTETSLRGAFGWEVKTAGRGVELIDALRSLNDLYPVLANSSGTWRAAVHVHVDASALAWTQRAMALCIAYAVDKSIFAAVSPERVESNFCPPLETKEELVGNFVKRMLEGAQDINEYAYGKYSSVNSNSLFRFGTFEFRHMQTPRTRGDVASVTACLNAIRRFARIAHDVVNNPAVRLLQPDADRDRFLYLLRSGLNLYPKTYDQIPIKVDSAAVLDVLAWLEDFGKVLPGTIDRPSIVRCASVFPRFRSGSLGGLEEYILNFVETQEDR